MASWTNIFSGKFLFTVVTALVFAYSAHAKIINGEQIYGIIMLVISFYFNKTSQQTDQNGGPNVPKIQNPNGVVVAPAASIVPSGSVGNNSSG